MTRYTDLELRDHDGRLRLDDSPMSAYLAQRLRPTHRYAPGLGWLKFDGKRWESITQDDLLVTTQHIFTELYVEEAPTADSHRRRALSGLLNKPKLTATTVLLRGLLAQDAADFDSIERAHLLNVQNGVVDLRTGELSPHDPDLLFTKITRAKFEPGARHPDWDKALEIFDDEDVRDWVQLKMGQAITGLPPTDAKLVILIGDGENGKSSLLECHSAVGDYASPMAERLVHSLPSHHPTELTDLKGVRMAYLEELPAGVLNMRRVKAMVGTSKMNARRVGKDSMTWQATHSLFITTNKKPQVPERDHGTWRRLALVTFSYTYVTEDRPLKEGERRGDQGLVERLKAGDGGRDEAMLAWLVEGAVKCYGGNGVQHLPPPPARVRTDTEQWRRGEDQVSQFIDDVLVFDPAWVALRTDVYQRYQAWAEARGVKPDNDQAFTDAFSAHESVVGNGVKGKRCRLSSLQVSRPARGAPPSAGRVWVGVRFRDEDDTPNEQTPGEAGEQ